MNIHKLGHSLGAVGSALAGAGAVTYLSGVPQHWIIYTMGLGFLLSSVGKGLQAYYDPEDTLSSKPTTTDPPPPNT